jgi:hypothetical protein
MSLRVALHRTAVAGIVLAGIALAAVVPAAQAPAPAAPAAGAPAPQGRGAAAPRGGYTEAATLPVRIMDFKADRVSIKPGETITLSWQVENPGGRGAAPGAAPVSISPSIGRIVPLGQMKVTPKATTTYTLTANGNGGPVTRTLTITVAGTAAVPVADDPGASAASQPAPRTLDGKPDLTGVYGYNANPGANAPAMSGDLPRQATLKPGAEKYRVVRGPTDTGLYATCRPPGVPQTFLVPYYLQIIQSPKHVVILHEYLTLPRIIEIGGELPADPDPFYMGHSVGRWDGDVLVVTSTGFKESEVSGIKTTESLKITERFRRQTMGTLEYEAVIDDPNVFATPWLLKRNFPFMPEHKRVDEFFCENNRDYKDLFGGK